MSDAARELVVRPYEPEDRLAWDDLVRRARAPHFMLTRGYSEYHADRFQDASLLVFEGSTLLAALPASRSEDTVSSHGGLTFGGFVTDRRMTAERMLGTLEAVVAHLRAGGVRRLIYKAVPAIYHRTPASEDVYALVRAGARLVRRDLSSTIELGDRLPYSKGRKAQVKRARGAYAVAQEPDFTDFWAIEEEALVRRHGLRPVHSLEEISLLAGRFPDELTLHCARDADGAVAAGVVIFATPVVAHTQYIASSEPGMAGGAVDAVIDHLLSDVYADRRYFDFGISTEQGGSVLNGGLVRNKESYGARGSVYDFYELELSSVA
jgi:hypothetical protein